MTDKSTRTGDLILALNCGPSSIKFALFEAGRQAPPRQPALGGKVQGIGGSAAEFSEPGAAPVALKLDAAKPYHAALEQIRQRMAVRLDARMAAASAGWCDRGLRTDAPWHAGVPMALCLANCCGTWASSYRSWVLIE